MSRLSCQLLVYFPTFVGRKLIPINLVQRVMGHEQASTTLNRYTHTPDDYAARVLAALDGSAALLLPLAGATLVGSALNEDEDGL